VKYCSAVGKVTTEQNTSEGIQRNKKKKQECSKKGGVKRGGGRLQRIGDKHTKNKQTNTKKER